LQPKEPDPGLRSQAGVGVARLPSGDNVRLGVAVILVATLALSLGDSAIKLLSADFALSQIFVFRSLIAIPVVVIIIKARSRAASLMPRRIGWVALRSLLLTFLWLAYYMALPHLALGVAAATFYTLPLFITLFAAIFIGDRIGAKGWGAVALGFVGALFILKPEAGGFNAYVLLPLGSAVLDALAMILTRTKCRGENSLVLSLSLNVTLVSVGLVVTAYTAIAGTSANDSSFILRAWSPMDASGWLAMAFLAAVAITASVGAATAYQVAPPATIATFDFAYVGFAGLWGILIFAEFPDARTILGIMLIVVAGIVAVRR